MSTVLVGRDEELSSIRHFLAGVSGGAVALVLEGEAGMGKTTLWTAGVEEAASRDLLTLDARPSESEESLSFSALGDLLEPVLDDVLDRLVPAQRRALARALVLDEDEGAAPDPHAVGVAVLNALRSLAELRPTLVAVDDVQWLDPASGSALAYAARRLDPERVGVLLARRTPLESGLQSELRRSLAPGRFTELPLSPLDPSALHQVIRNELGIALPRPLLAEVRDASGGNPFYALEIARMLQRTRTSVEAGHPLPVPDSLHELVDARVLTLPVESRDFLLAASAHAHPTLAITEAASGVTAEAGLPPALEAGIVDLDGDRIRFTHPLLAAGAYETGDPLRRREIHVRLAELLSDPEAHAWQLAACGGEPDEAVASALEDAARHARARGAPRPAALLLDRASELTPASLTEHAHRRAIEAAYLCFESGDAKRAEVTLQDLVTSVGPGITRARALWVLARIRTYERPLDAADLFLEVVEGARGSAELEAAAHEGVASSLYYALERLSESAAHAEAALELARQLGDLTLVGDILISKLGVEVLLGDPDLAATSEAAQELQTAAGDRRVLDQPLIAVAESWIWTDAPGRARDALLGLLRQAEEIGDESARPYLMFLLGNAECLLGRLEESLEHAREGEAAAEQSGQPLFAAYNLGLQCLVQAQLGVAGTALEVAERALKPVSVELVKLFVASGVGHLQHVQSASERALDALRPALEFLRREGIVEPGATRFVVDQVEAFLELGRREEAIGLVEWYEGNARRLGRVSALANCTRCRGLLSAQEGDLDTALPAFEEALSLHEQVEIPLDRGRTLLAFGATLRRAKRRKEARATLEEALGVFEGIGAALWAERARAELKRISGRAATPGALTPAEGRVAALVAEGKTNREVAAALYVSDRTVEGHLARIFGKLGIRHRAELAGALQTQGIALSNTGDSPVSAGPSAP